MYDINQLTDGVIRSVRAAFGGHDIGTMARRVMTKHLFRELDRLGKSLRVDVRGAIRWGFLYDVCFLVTFGESQHGYFAPQTPLRKSLLVLECELDEDEEEILYDFTKLLMARSELRSFVFYSQTRAGFEAILQTLREAIDSFKQGAEADRYLICGLVPYDRLQFVLLNGNGNIIWQR